VTPRTPLPRCCPSYEKIGSSARALSSPPPGILSYDLSIAAVAAASARTAALLGAGPEQTASAVEDAVESFFRTMRKQEPKPSRTLYFDLYQDDEEEDDDDERTCEPAEPFADSASDRITPTGSDRITPTGTSRSSGHASYGGSSPGDEGTLHTPLAHMANSRLSPHSGGSGTRAFSAGAQLRNPWSGGGLQTAAESSAGMHWDAHNPLSGIGNLPPAPAWAASSGAGFHTDGPSGHWPPGSSHLSSPRSPLGLPPRPRARPPPPRYGKLPRSKGVRASQLLDGALTSAFVL